MIRKIKNHFSIILLMPLISFSLQTIQKTIDRIGSAKTILDIDIALKMGA